jgi:hypothetical protein
MCYRKPVRFAFTLAAITITVAGLAQPISLAKAVAPGQQKYVGFDANDYPGDDQLPALRKQFSFTGYWLTNPPGADHNPWVGKRNLLLQNGFGFLVVANGRLDKEVLKAQKTGKSPAAFAREDAATAVAAARREGFPAGTILFLDQEEGGRLLDEQADYLLAWTEAVAGTAYRPGVYASGQPVPDGKSATITTIQDVRQRVVAGHLHAIAFWDAQDACPPAPGCTVQPDKVRPPDESGTPSLDVWQYAQSPRRKSITQACGLTYSRDGNCYAPSLGHYQLDLDVSTSPDPSHGR